MNDKLFNAVSETVQQFNSILYTTKCDALRIVMPDLYAALHTLRCEVLEHDLVVCIEQHAKDGKIAVVESGRDCDCVEYSGRVHIIDATLEAYSELFDRTSEWADGPFYFAIDFPDVEVEYESRDLVMEAYEDGHPHHIVSRYP